MTNCNKFYSLMTFEYNCSIMNKDSSNSKIDRQNILNNTFAIQEIEKATNITGVILKKKWICKTGKT